MAPLRVEQSELADVAGAGARAGERRGAARRPDRARLRLGLLGEQAQRGELVLDVLDATSTCSRYCATAGGAEQAGIESTSAEMDAAIAQYREQVLVAVPATSRTSSPRSVFSPTRRRRRSAP